MILVSIEQRIKRFLIFNGQIIQSKLKNKRIFSNHNHLRTESTYYLIKKIQLNKNI